MISVFLVDDETVIRQGLKKLIPWEDNGFAISGEASDGEEALKGITPQNTDILITDLKMPFMDGLHLAEKIKQKWPHMEIVILTGYGDFSNIQKGLRSGVADFLLKPVNRGELIQTLLRIKEKLESRRYLYSLSLEKQLLEDIRRGDEAGVRQALKELFESFDMQKAQEADRHHALKTLLHAVDQYLTAMGLSLKGIIGEQLLSELFRSGNTEEVKRRMAEVLQAVIHYKDGGQTAGLIDRVCEYLEQNYHQDLSLTRVSKHFFLNPSYLSRLFKNERGETYSDFLTKVRIQHARKMLAGSQFTVQQISEMVGFNDRQYFSRVFRELQGMRPLQYREQQQGGGAP